MQIVVMGRNVDGGEVSSYAGSGRSRSTAYGELKRCLKEKSLGSKRTVIWSSSVLQYVA